MQNMFDIVLLRGVMSRVGEEEGVAHLWYRLGEGAVVEEVAGVQVYVDGELFDVLPVGDHGVGEAWLPLDRGVSHRVELVAVQEDVWRARDVQAWEPPVVDRAGVAVLRDERLPAGAGVRVALDGDTVHQAAMWGPGDPRSGFGGWFGVGGFGFDAASGPGLGEGPLGWGPLGSDGEPWRWRDGRLPAGEHSVTAEATDSGGRVVEASTATVTIAANPLPGGVRATMDGAWVLRW